MAPQTKENSQGLPKEAQESQRGREQDEDAKEEEVSKREWATVSNTPGKPAKEG